ncbi:hypothetical protein CMV30_03985 [Nibricoccus aquaticus]|uniref:Uncharacterized protein n=1 Tax=Nibricoccus aquaticus TaxID=2576891 RepID=A0A290QH33_9BACT|nr:hypothetical protein [Nibricoccus aquaticus]ATC63182.1 hypothetical protein CMV30_03985 [Nibricoccus aquaticus]
MKILPAIIFWICTACASYAGHEKIEDLADSLEKAVVFASKGDFASAARAINAETRSPQSPKEVIERTDYLKHLYDQIAVLGEKDEVERLSLRLAGISFARLKVIDKRAEGAVIWTFIGYRYRGQWYCKNLSVAGSEDFLKLMREELDAADATPVTSGSTAD